MQKVIIIGNSYTSRLGVARSVAQMGCEVIIIAIDFYNNINTAPKPIDCYSKDVSNYYLFERKEGPEGLIKLLLEKCKDDKQKPIIIPDSDFSAVTIDNHLHLLEKYFLLPHINHEEGAIARWMDKLRQKQLAQQVGLNVPNAIVIEEENGQYHIPDNLRYPCFTKPLASIGGGKKCISRINNKRELLVILQIAKKNGIKRLLIEDFIQIEKEYAVLGFSDGKEVVIPGIIEFVKSSKAHPGIALLGTVKSTLGFEEIIEKFKSLVLKMGFIGIFDIDFFECNEVIYFAEMNLRFGGSGYAITAMGVNLPGMFVRCLQGLPIDNMNNKVENQAFFVNERICMDDWLAGMLSSKDYRKDINSAEIHFIGKDDDLVPQRVFEKRYMKNVFSWKRIAKFIINRCKK